MMLKNDWINPMHTVVPGTDGKLSYGGYCFPKDTNALLEFMKKNNSPSEVLEATISERNKMREENKFKRLNGQDDARSKANFYNVTVLSALFMLIYIPFNSC